MFKKKNPVRNECYNKNTTYQNALAETPLANEVQLSPNKNRNREMHPTPFCQQCPAGPLSVPEGHSRPAPAVPRTWR